MSTKKIEIEVAVYYTVKKTVDVSEISEDSEISENIVKELEKLSEEGDTIYAYYPNNNYPNASKWLTFTIEEGDCEEKEFTIENFKTLT